MAITMLMAEDGGDTPVAFALPKKLAPYVREFFNDAKRDGETIDSFIGRIVCEQGVHHVRRRTVTGREAVRRNDQFTDDAELGTEASNLLKP